MLLSNINDNIFMTLIDILQRQTFQLLLKQALLIDDIYFEMILILYKVHIFDHISKSERITIIT